MAEPTGKAADHVDQGGPLGGWVVGVGLTAGIRMICGTENPSDAQRDYRVDQVCGFLAVGIAPVHMPPLVRRVAPAVALRSVRA